MQGLVKYQINDPNISVQQIEALIHDQKKTLFTQQ